MKDRKIQKLVFFGAAGLALSNSLRLLLDRAGRTTDLTDFGTGIVMGVGIGFMLLAAIYIGRQRRTRC